MKFEVETDYEAFVLGAGWSWGLAAVEIRFAFWALLFYYDR